MLFDFLKKKRQEKADDQQHWRERWQSLVPEENRSVPVTVDGQTRIAYIQINQFVVMLQAAQQETRLVGRQVTVHPGRKLLLVMVVDLVGAHGRLRSRVALSLSTKGRSSTSMASRARKMRERTVPMGQFIFAAISS